MPDFEHTDGLEAKHEQNRQERLEGIKRWVQYIQENPPDVWGEEQNTLVNTPLQSARESSLSVEHQRRVLGRIEHVQDRLRIEMPIFVHRDERALGTEQVRAANVVGVDRVEPGVRRGGIRRNRPRGIIFGPRRKREIYRRILSLSS